MREETMKANFETTVPLISIISVIDKFLKA